MQDLLLQLRDISPPLAPGWLPPAPGWWFLIFITGCSIATWLVVRQRRRLFYFRLAMTRLNQLAISYDADGDQQKLAIGLSHWIRQVALLAYPQRQVAGLTGTSWVSFLDASMAGREFTGGAGYIFAGAVYASDVDFDAARLLDLCRRWLTRIKPRLMRQCSV